MNIGIVGYRGMVGSVLMQRLGKGNVLKKNHGIFCFSTSQVGVDIPYGNKVKNANDIDALKQCNIIVSCQGGEYTKKIHPRLRSDNWSGYWIDAASTLRMEKDSIIVLDPVNGTAIREGIKNGVKDFIGGNCTTSLMLLALHGLFKNDLVEWVTSMTYQAASGAGAKNMRELLSQMHVIGASFEKGEKSILKIDEQISEALRSDAMPTENFGVPLAGSLIPWIDSPMGNGQTREEWKANAEGNKILSRGDNVIPIDGQCVRIGAMRCHSQAFTIKLKEDLSSEYLESIIDNANEWVSVVSNTKEETIKKLTPTAVSGTLSIPVGRIRKTNIDSRIITAFTVGDQLLWGAAEPLRRILEILIN